MFIETDLENETEHKSVKKHTHLEHLKLWIGNWKYNRLLPVSIARDPFSRPLRWYELLFCCFATWGTVVDALRNGEYVPAGVMLCGAPPTMQDMDLANRVADEIVREHPELFDENGEWVLPKAQGEKLTEAQAVMAEEAG